MQDDRESSGPPDRDPVCGMTVRIGAPHVVEHDGRTLRFCSKGCREKFEAEPERCLEGGDERSRTEPASPPAR